VFPPLSADNADGEQKEGAQEVLDAQRRTTRALAVRVGRAGAGQPKVLQALQIA